MVNCVKNLDAPLSLHRSCLRPLCLLCLLHDDPLVMFSGSALHHLFSMSLVGGSLGVSVSIVAFILDKCPCGGSHEFAAKAELLPEEASSLLAQLHEVEVKLVTRYHKLLWAFQFRSTCRGS